MPTLKEKYQRGKLIPIFSNAFFINRLFTSNADPYPSYHFDETIAQNWAQNSQYPFRDRYDLANVAQYNLFRRFSNEEDVEEESIKDEYNRTLGELLSKHLAETDNEAYQYSLRLNQESSSETSISRFCEAINIPKYIGDSKEEKIEKNGLLKIINQNNIKSYLTTSCYDFLEQAFGIVEQPYYTNFYGSKHGFQFIDGKGNPGEKLDDPSDSIYPYIYHILGHEKKPETMILCEDDHINFLLENKQPAGELYTRKETNIPLFLPSAFADNSLLFFGYRWQDWEFRTIFRWIVGVKHNERRSYLKKSVVVQFQPGPKELLAGEGAAKAARDYLEKYFGQHCHLDILWEDAEAFLRELVL